MGEDQQRAGRAENRRLAQLETELENLRKDLDTQLELLGDTVLLHETALDQVNSAMTDTHCRGPNVPIAPFHGNRNEDFAQYIKQFELICTANNYAVDKRAQILGSYLRDKAFFIYDSLPNATKADYALLKAALEDKFQTADHRRYAHQKFQGRRQMPTETVPDHACDLHRMGLSALADVDTDQRDALIRENFIAGLLPHLRELIVYSNPTSFHEALTLAERLEGLQAAKTDNSAKNVLLLENISDRLANLEVKSQDTRAVNFPQEVAYVMDAPNRRAEDGLSIQRKFNLGNYRQNFRPTGMVCFRCNRTGHMARNCLRNRNMSTVVCRVCNRMGHFPRDCQRRGASLGRRFALAGGNTSLNRANPMQVPPRPARPNRTMVMTAFQPQATACDDTTAPTEFIPWKPLVATMWLNKPTLSSGEKSATLCASPDDHKIMRVEDVDIPQTTANVGNETMDPDSMESEVVQHDPLNCAAETEPVDRPPSIYRLINLAGSVVDRVTSAVWRGLAPLCCWWMMVMISIATATDGGDKYRHSEPMLCQAFEGKALWKLPTTFNCPEGNHSMARQVIPARFRLYKRNYIQYKSEAWKCVRLTEEVRTFSYFFGDENLKKEKSTQRP